MMIDLSKESWEVAYQAGGETDLATAKMLITGADGWLLVGWEVNEHSNFQVGSNFENWLTYLSCKARNFWFQTGVAGTCAPECDLTKVTQICKMGLKVNQLVHAITVAQGKASV